MSRLKKPLTLKNSKSFYCLHEIRRSVGWAEKCLLCLLVYLTTLHQSKTFTRWNDKLNINDKVWSQTVRSALRYGSKTCLDRLRKITRHAVLETAPLRPRHDPGPSGIWNSPGSHHNTAMAGQATVT
jgi:hypothetical protein